jgi:phytoene/squalene synthetase
VLTLADVSDPAATRRSDQVCAALQVLEHCQDVREDAVAGRVYLPARDLDAAGVRDADLQLTSTPPQLRRAVAIQVTRSERLLGAGGQLVGQLRGWARIAVAGYVAGGRATAAALRGANYDVLAGHIGPGKLSTLRYATVALGR